MEHPFELLVTGDLTVHSSQPGDVGQPAAHLLLIAHNACCHVVRRNLGQSGANPLPFLAAPVQQGNVIRIKQIHRLPEWAAIADTPPRGASLRRRQGRP